MGGQGDAPLELPPRWGREGVTLIASSKLKKYGQRQDFYRTVISFHSLPLPIYPTDSTSFDFCLFKENGYFLQRSFSRSVHSFLKSRFFPHHHGPKHAPIINQTLIQMPFPVSRKDSVTTKPSHVVYWYVKRPCDTKKKLQRRKQQWQILYRHHRQKVRFANSRARLQAFRRST